MARTVELTTKLACSAEEAWEWVRKPVLLEHITHPLMRFEFDEPVGPFETWPAGEHRAQLFAFGKIPIGWQVIGIEYPETEAGRFLLRDNGYSPMIKRWDHWIIITSGLVEGHATYTDRVHIEAGPLTMGVAAYAKRFYAHRQKRWRALAKSDFAALQR